MINRSLIVMWWVFVLGLLWAAPGDAGWRRRCRVRCQAPCQVAAGNRDYRLQTDKRVLPEFHEPRPSLFVESFVEPDEDTFTVRNHDRGMAKTTFADAPVEAFADLASLILSLPDDESMVERTVKRWDFARVAEEQRNVRVTAYLFAVQKESDNDYHLILDDDGFLEEGAKFNSEISGVPNEGPDQERIRQVRQQFKDHFGGSPPATYRPFLGPIRVIIESSLFFDRDHPSGVVGPQGYRPASAWEIHPIRRIDFLND